MRSLIPLFLLCSVAAMEMAAPGPQLPGPKPEGFLLFNGWRLAPAGMQVPLPDTFPMSLALDAAGKRLFVLNAGYTEPSLMILDPTQPAREGGALRLALSHAWLGLALHPQGDRFYVPEGAAGTVREFSI